MNHQQTKPVAVERCDRYWELSQRLWATEPDSEARKDAALSIHYHIFYCQDCQAWWVQMKGKENEPASKTEQV